jgi:cytochrome P450
MDFTPPYPRPHKTRSSLFWRFIRGWHSWIHVLFEKSYSMKMGHVRQRGTDVYMVNEPSLVKRVLTSEAALFPKQDLMHQMLEPLLGSSVFTTNGPVWERQRRFVDQALTQSRLQTVFPSMLQSVGHLLSRLDPLADGRSLEIDAEMTCVTADVMFRTILSQPLEQTDANAIYSAFLSFQNQAQRAAVLLLYGLPAFFHKRASRKAAATIRSILAEIVQKRFSLAEQNLPLPRDILTGLMEAEDPLHNDRFSYQEVLDQVCMLFLAGHETSASALSWSLYLISNAPDIQARLLAEVTREVGSREFQYGDTHRLKLVWNVFREALRLYPPVGFIVRQASQTEEMRDKQVKKGCPILISPWLLHRHREHWQQPDVFDPDRFNSEKGKESVRCAFIPFSAGPRVCSGAAFATQEAVLVLAALIRRFQILPDPDHLPKPVGRLTVRSSNGIRLRLLPRQSAPPEAPSCPASANPA